jgi:hypothetical protein
VGHIGGDDFIFTVPLGRMEEVCDEILDLFDELIPYQYTPDDQEAGYFLGRDRRGSIHRVPLMTLSIGVVTNLSRTYRHPAQVSGRAGEMKSYAKTLPGSVYVVDRRHGESLSGERSESFPTGVENHTESEDRRSSDPESTAFPPATEAS